MTKFQKLEARAIAAETELAQLKQTYSDVLERAKQRERGDHVRQRRDMLANAACVLLIGLGIAVAVYSFAMFTHWCEYGY
jgi:hypothetical protein